MPAKKQHVKDQNYRKRRVNAVWRDVVRVTDP